VTASDVKLDTGGLSRMILGQSSARTGPSSFSKKYLCISIAYLPIRETTEPAWQPPFLPGGKICRPQRAKQARLIASREYGLY
jgi:hypothetical protein